MGLAAVVLVVTACGSGTQGNVTVAGRPTGTTAPAANTTAMPVARTDLGQFPVYDTVLSTGELPAAQTRAFEQLGFLRKVPGREIFAQAPAMPAPANHADGRVSDAQVLVIELGFWRTEALIQWAQLHGEDNFIAVTLMGQQEGGFLVPDAQTALNDGGTVNDPNCDLFSISFALWPHAAAVDGWIGTAGFYTQAPDVFMVPFNEDGCLLTITDKGKVSTEPADPTHPQSVDRVLWVGELLDDPVLGLYFRVEASTNCDRTGAVAQMCNA